jgi:wyosine [tRNA(Phe)-imidazoG37] synthetase (radical SAM superfamily)
MRLTTRIHDRDAAGLTYVYPVVSRRAGGVSVGVNLCPNNACNWRCIYCQVPDLVLGKPPEIDLPRLADELERMLVALLTGDWMERHVPEGARRLNDLAFSGNGEPTASPQFVEAVELVGEAMARHELVGRVDLVLITNGSLMHRSDVQRGLARMAEFGGQVWFKLDSATDEGQAALNSNRAGAERSYEWLRTSSGLCPTWLQTLVLARGGEPPSEHEQEAYLALLARALSDGLPLRGVQLYGLARVSHQPEAPELSALPVAWLEAHAERIRALGLEVRVAP